MLDPNTLPYRTIVMAISGILQSVIPLGLYGLLWRRMSKAGAPGRSRALFLMLGIVFLIFGTAGGSAVTPLSSTLILSAFVIWWLGITGRADQLLKTTE
jgi:Na+/proline symporter